MVSSELSKTPIYSILLNSKDKEMANQTGNDFHKIQDVIVKLQNSEF